jgi:hypothetical protein
MEGSEPCDGRRGEETRTASSERRGGDTGLHGDRVRGACAAALNPLSLDGLHQSNTHSLDQAVGRDDSHTQGASFTLP